MFASAPPTNDWLQKQTRKSGGGGGGTSDKDGESLQTADLDGNEGLRGGSSGRPSASRQAQLDPSSSEFSTIRYRLDQLDYKEWMDPVSLPLVKRLLSDLINTTQVAREWKHLGTGLQEEVRVLSEQVNPLRKELSGLEQENGMLHREIIEMQDARDTMTRMHQAQQRKMDKEMQELRFMNSQLLAEVARERDRARASFKKVEELGEKVGLIVTPDDGFTIKQQDKAAKAKLFERVQKIDIETGLAPLDTDRPFPPSNPSFVDLVVLAEERARMHESASKDQSSKVSVLQEEIQTLLEQVSKRDREITRLSSQLELVRNNQFTTGLRDSKTASGMVAGSPSLHGLTDLDAAKERIMTLDLQIESLATHIESLESEIAQMNGQKINVLTSLTEDKKKVELDLERERKKVSVLTGNVERMQAIVDELEGYRSKIAGSGVAGATVKPSVAVKNAKLVQELTLKLNTSAVKHEQSTKRLAMLHKDVTRLQNENGKLKARVEQLEKVPVTAPTSAQPAPSTVPAASSSSLPNEDTSKLHLQEKLEQSEVSRRSLQTKVNNLERNFSSQTQQLETLMVKLETTDRALQDCKLEKGTLTSTIRDISAEKDDLRHAIGLIETSVEEVCTRVEQVCKERDVARELYNQVHSELERIRNAGNAGQVAVHGTEKNGDKEVELREKIVALEKEREELKGTVQDLQNQVVLLKDDMKALLLRQRENGSLAGEAVSLLEKELEELQSRIDSSEHEKKDLKSQITSLQTELNNSSKEHASITKQYEHENRKLLQLELDLEKSKLEVRQAAAARTDAETRLRVAEVAMAELETKGLDKDRLLGEQKGLLDEIDRERDTFQRELDNKAEKLLQLQDQLIEAQQQFAVSEKKSSTLQEQVDALTKHLNTSDREISSLSKQLTDATTASKHWEDQAQQYHSEGQRLASDLVALTRENQILSGELGEASSVRDRYRAELVECENQLGTLNEFIRSKDEEKQEIMTNYRRVIADHERLEVVYRSNIEEANNLRMELVSRDKKIGTMERQLDQVSRDATQFQMDNNAHSKQHSNLSRALATSERQIKQLEADKLRLSREIQAARELAHSVDRNKDSVQSQFMQLSLEHDRLVNKLEKTSVEMSALQNQLKAEVLKSERLEQLLNSERTRKIQTERSDLDMKQSQSQMEARMRQLNEQQEISLAATRGQLDDAKKALMASGDRIGILESLIAQKDSENKELNLALNTSKIESIQLKEDIKKLRQNIEDLVLRSSHQGPVESRILNEIQHTQRERALVTDRIEHSMSAAASSSSLASKSTVGNNDVAAFNNPQNFNRQVLETIVDHEQQISPSREREGSA